MQSNIVLALPQINYARIGQRRCSQLSAKNYRAVLSWAFNNSNALPETHFVLKNMVIHGSLHQYARRRCFRDAGAAVLQTAAVNELRARKLTKIKNVTN